MSQCEAKVSVPGVWSKVRQCSRTALLSGKFCKTHDPDIIKAKNAARQALWDKEYAERNVRAKLNAAAPKLLEACRKLLSRYIALVESGDCGCWNYNEEQEVKDAEAAIKLAEGKL